MSWHIAQIRARGQRFTVRYRSRDVAAALLAVRDWRRKKLIKRSEAYELSKQISRTMILAYSSTLTDHRLADLN